MREASEVSVRPVEAPAGQGPLAEIVVDGAATGATVAGALLEAAVALDGEYLLFLTDDVPQEDMLSIHLVDRAGRLLDSARIGAMYATGSFSGLRLREPNRVTFRFIGDIDWTVEVFPEAKVQMPFVSDPPGVSRSLALRRRFRLEGHPRPG